MLGGALEDPSNIGGRPTSLNWDYIILRIPDGALVASVPSGIKTNIPTRPAICRPSLSALRGLGNLSSFLRDKAEVLELHDVSLGLGE